MEKRIIVVIVISLIVGVFIGSQINTTNTIDNSYTDNVWKESYEMCIERKEKVDGMRFCLSNAIQRELGTGGENTLANGIIYDCIAQSGWEGG